MFTPLASATRSLAECKQLTSVDGHELSPTDVRAARRAVSVALFMSLSFDEAHSVHAHLPPYADLMRVLDVIGWAGTPEQDIVINPLEHRVLLDAVYVMLVLAFEEGLRIVDEVLSAADGGRQVDESALLAATSMARLALSLQGNDQALESPEGSSRSRSDDAVPSALRALADSVGLPVWIAATDSTLDWVNAPLEALLDADLRHVRGTRLHDWIDPSDATRMDQVLDAARSEHRNWSVEVGVGPMGGPYARLLVIAAPRTDARGALIGWTGICFDVSQNPALAARLSHVTQSVSVTSAKTNLMLRQLPAMIWTTDTELRCTFSHGAVFQSLGAAPNQLVGRTVPEIVGTTDPSHPAVIAHIRALHGTAASYRDSFADRTFDVTVEPLREPDGAVFGCIGLGIEVTDRLERERRVEQLLRQLRFGQQIGRMGTWEHDVSGGTWIWSEEAYRLLGTEPGAVEPSFAAFIDRVHPDDRAELIARHAEGERTRRQYEMNYRLIRPDGQVRRMRGVVQFECNSEDELIRVAGILQDITDASG